MMGFDEKNLTREKNVNVKRDSVNYETFEVKVNEDSQRETTAAIVASLLAPLFLIICLCVLSVVCVLACCIMKKMK